MSAWLSKWAPASGALAGVLVAIAFFARPNSPGTDASGAQVIAWYGSHHSSDERDELKSLAEAMDLPAGPLAGLNVQG